MTVIMQC